MSKWIDFVERPQEQGKKTKVWDVVNKDSSANLGRVGWYGPWRGYAFVPAHHTLFERQCLRDIADFIESQNKARKEERAAEKASSQGL